MSTRRASDRDPELDATPKPAVKRDPLREGKPGGYVRVKHPKSGDHYTTTRVLALKAGATPLDQPAVDKDGRPLPRKRNTKEF